MLTCFSRLLFVLRLLTQEQNSILAYGCPSYSDAEIQTKLASFFLLLEKQENGKNLFSVKKIHLK